jgi:PEP-CTERM motif
MAFDWLSDLLNQIFGSHTGSTNGLGSKGTVPVPEPATLTLMLAGLAGIGALRRKKAS